MAAGAHGPAPPPTHDVGGLNLHPALSNPTRMLAPPTTAAASPPTPSSRKDILQRLVLAFANNGDYCHLLSISVPLHEHLLLRDALHKCTVDENDHQFVDIVSDFLQWCSRNRVPNNIRAAIEARKALHACRFRLHRTLKTTLWLNHDNKRLRTFLEQIPARSVTPLQQPYPPMGYWVYESEEIYNLWDHHLTRGKQPDKRLKRRPLMHLDPVRLTHDLLHDESAIFYNGSTIEAIVIRNFCKDERAMHWANGIVEENVQVKRGARVRNNLLLPSSCTNDLLSLRTQEKWSLQDTLLVRAVGPHLAGPKICSLPSCRQHMSNQWTMQPVLHLHCSGTWQRTSYQLKSSMT
jgi:hypothetical protein